MKQPMAGWIGFAGLMMLIIGSLDFFEGLIAIARGQYYLIHGNQLVVFDTTTWGWITLILGVMELLASASLFGGGAFGRWFGILAAALVAIESLLQVGSYPILSGSQTMKLSRFGIFTCGRLLASITSFSPMILLSERI